ncbi:hypothetical protein GCM10018987_35390 [Streptomyces cremeus]
MRAEQDPGQDEQGDGRQTDPAAEPGEDSGGEKGAAHGYECVCVSDGTVPPVASGDRQRGEVKRASRNRQ